MEKKDFNCHEKFLMSWGFFRMKCNDRNMTTRFSLMTKLLVLIKGNEIKDIFCAHILMELAVAWDTFVWILILL